MTGLVLQLRRLASEIRVRAEQHGQFGAVERAKPWRRGEVSPGTCVDIAVSREASLLAETRALCGRAEESREESRFR